MFLTLILVPVIYMKVETWRVTVPAFFKKIFKKKNKQEDLGFESK
jgi:hypothetical protein